MLDKEAFLGFVPRPGLIQTKASHFLGSVAERVRSASPLSLPRQCSQPVVMDKNTRLAFLHRSHMS